MNLPSKRANASRPSCLVKNSRKPHRAIACIVLAALAIPLPGWCATQPIAELKVHVAQANNVAGYAFVRARFEPGELSDPWAVRFFDARGGEIPYFVWDAQDWATARDGRPDWGGQYALLQHHPGNDPKVLAARGEKIAWARDHWPEIGQRLEAQSVAAGKSPRSICAALYLLRYPTQPYAKDELALRIYATRQREVERQDFADQAGDAVAGGLALQGFPLHPIVKWKGAELFHYAGFGAADVESAHAHADAARGYRWSIERGLVTKVHLIGKTEGRLNGETNWDCTYWLFPEGACVGLEGFSIGKPDHYAGGQQEMSVWESGGAFTEVSTPRWETPWYVHQTAAGKAVATHLFRNAPLSIGYDNNPFITGEADKRGIRIDGNHLALGWTYDMWSYPSVRMFLPDTRFFSNLHPNGKQLDAIARWMREHPGEAPNVESLPEAKGMDAKDLASILPALPAFQWKPQTDWLYREYAFGVGDNRKEAEDAVRKPVCAAGGWIDREWKEKDLADLLIRCVRNLAESFPVAQKDAERAAINVDYDWYLLRAFALQDRDSLAALAGKANLTSQVERRIPEMQKLLAEGKDAVNTASRRPGAAGPNKDTASPLELQKDRQAAWMANPAYVARSLGDQLRFLEWSGVSYRKEEYQGAVRTFADFTLKLFGGEPFDMHRYRERYQEEWPSRVAMLIPLMLDAYRITGEERYAQAARVVFDDAFASIEKNPLGYLDPWGFDPKEDRPFDTTYNVSGFWRGYGAFWQNRQLSLIGDKGTKLVAADARWVVMGRLYSDNLETDSTTYYASAHGGHPGTRVGLFEFLHDDFAFYRGLVGDLLRWQLLAPERYDGNAYRLPCEGGPRKSDAVWLEWALGVYGGEKWDGKTIGRRGAAQ